MTQTFELHAAFQPSGDQPQAIKLLIEGVQQGLAHQTLLGVTGSGKTFTMANVIMSIQRPTLILAPNKTLAAQLYGEMKAFFPTTLSNILFLIMIIISLKPMCLLLIPISRKTHRSMNI